MMQKQQFCDAIRLYENAMYAVAFSIVQNDADAAEVLSESVYRAYKNLSKLRNENAFKSWLLHIVHNTAIEEVRKQGRHIYMDTLPDEGVDTNVENTTKLALHDAVEQLKQPYQTVTILFYYENLTTQEIAEVTEIAETTVRKQLSRARTMLKEILKEDFLNA